MCSSTIYIFCFALDTTQEIPVRPPPSPNPHLLGISSDCLWREYGYMYLLELQRWERERREGEKGKGRGMPAITTPFFILPINFTLILLCHLSRSLLIRIFKYWKGQVQECSLILFNVLLIVSLGNQYFGVSYSRCSLLLCQSPSFYPSLFPLVTGYWAVYRICVAQ